MKEVVTPVKRQTFRPLHQNSVLVGACCGDEQRYVGKRGRIVSGARVVKILLRWLPR